MANLEWEVIAERGRSHGIHIIEIVMETYLEIASGKRKSEYTAKQYRQVDAGKQNGRGMGSRDVQQYIDTLKEMEKKNPNALYELALTSERDVEEGKRAADAIAKEAYAPPSEWSELAEGIELMGNAFKALTQRCYHYLMINKFYPDSVSQAIAQRISDPHEQARIANILFTCSKPTGIRKEKKELLMLAQEMKKNAWDIHRPEVHERLTAIAEQYGALGIYVMWGEPFTAETLKPRLKELLESDREKMEQALNKQERVLQDTEDIMKKLKFTPEEAIRVKTIQEWAFEANNRDEAYGYITRQCIPLLNECARRFGISRHDLLEMRKHEILKQLERKEKMGEAFQKQIAARDGAHAIVLENGRVHLYEGAEFQAYFEKEMKLEEKMHHMQELRGQTASPGSVSGNVRLIHGIEDVPKLEKGEILVATATMPAYVPAMEKAAAIVTNEGGQLCHAAIVSRELGVPCIVGTKMATHVFQDGERVEVDATHGVVRKLSVQRKS
ncbi:hypothetical protein KJ765_01365 [Candidatus Micrarchaeota archaeon]|nr:hypothetical protein [Candidatus Micrarchaeota archaeon]